MATQTQAEQQYRDECRKLFGPKWGWWEDQAAMQFHFDGKTPAEAVAEMDRQYVIRRADRNA